MKYDLEQREIDIKGIMEELEEIRRAKGHDYSTKEDVFSNLRTFGFAGTVIRMEDKMQRLINFLQKGMLAVKSEGVEDTLKDLVNYALFALILFRQGRKEDE